ncbi:protein shisa-5-like isoform X2 [Gymnodraco acuticeps]|uniref:Protein shisa-5 n=1 Tax=Gymnodraco acuticeps TaxID=8218 RepID=A0A6P8SV07_GYMAC|nr:protein shisa-5-like isoform X2 [Gymnodraco acuticeps]
MVSGVLFSLVCAFCVILIPAVWADDCSSYVDSDGNQHNTQQCGIQYCCGNCQKQYCCSDKTNRFRRSKQKLCEGSLAKRSNPIPIIGIILASVIPIIICVVVVIVCCVVPCCFFYKKCRKGRNQRPRTARNTPTVVNVPQQPHPPPGYHPSYPGYLFVSAQPGYGGVPLPSAPPSYLEARAGFSTTTDVMSSCFFLGMIVECTTALKSDCVGSHQLNILYELFL